MRARRDTGGHARVSGSGLHLLVEQAHHEGLEVGPPPLREAVPDLPIILRAMRLIELAWRACQQRLSQGSEWTYLRRSVEPGAHPGAA